MSHPPFIAFDKQCPRCNIWCYNWELRTVGCNNCAHQDEYEAPQLSIELPPPDRPRCTTCRAELCAELDAYYGRDLVGSGKCDMCRRGRRCL